MNSGSEDRVLRLVVAAGFLSQEAADRASIAALARGVPLRVTLLEAGVPAQVLSDLERATMGMVLSADGATVVSGGPTAVVARAPAVQNPADENRLGPYELLAQVGRGGMGVVYRARHVGLNRIVAVKTLIDAASADSRERFMREARTTARLAKHPNLVQVHDVGESGGTHYIAMEFVEGRPLDRVLRDERIPPRRIAEIVEKTARGLAFAHAAGVVHRDLKPANILLDAAGEPHLADFGLARDVQAGAQLSLTGAVIGTPAYMAPEQAEGRSADVGERTDVYGLGAVLYEGLAGREPFVGASVMDVIRQVVETEPTPPSRLSPGVPPDLDIVALQCLAKSPAERYASASALADDLARWLRGDGILARPLPWTTRTFRRARRHAFPLILTAAALALATWGSVAAVQSVRARTVRDREQAEADEGRRQSEDRARRFDALYLPVAQIFCQSAHLGGLVTARIEIISFAGSERDLRAALEIDPAHPEARRLLARLLLRSGRTAEAAAESERLARDRPLDADALWDKFMAHVQLLLDALGPSTDLNFSGIQTLGSRRHHRVYANPSPEAARLRADIDSDLAEIARLPDGASRGELGRASILSLEGRFEEALAAVDAVLAKEPGFLDAEIYRAQLLGRLERPDSLEARRRLAQAFPLDASFQHELSLVEPEWEDAKAAISRAIELDPGETWYRSQRVFRCLQHDQYADAVIAAEEAVRHSPYSAYAWMARSNARYLSGDLPEAFASLEKAKERSLVRDADAVQFEAVLNREAGRHERAEELYQECLSQTPGIPVFVWGRGRSRVLCGRYAEGAHDMLDAVAGGDMDERSRRLLESRRAPIEKQAAGLKSPLEAGKMIEGVSALVRLSLPANATPDLKRQIEASAEVMMDLALDLYEQAGAWKDARRALKIGIRYHRLRWVEPFRRARMDALRGRFESAAKRLVEAKGLGLSSLGTVRMDDRFAAFRASPEYAALFSEWGPEPGSGR